MPIRVSSRVARHVFTAILGAAAVLAGLLALAAPAESVVTMRSCGTVVFTPNSEDAATNIRTKDVSCAYARAFVRNSNGLPAGRYRGFACERRWIERDDALPYRRVQCVRGAKAIHWKRY